MIAQFEEAMIKRKQPSSPTSFLPNKRQTRAESPIPLWPHGQPLEVIPGKGEQISKQPEVIKQKLGQPHSSVSAVVEEEQNVECQFDREGEAAPNTSSVVEVENISQFQPQGVACTSADAATGSATDCKTDEGSTPLVLGQDLVKQSAGTTEAASVMSNPATSTVSGSSQKIQKHVVPTHAGWFSWDKVHTLERRGVPEFFNGKSKTKTHDLYLEYRNLLIQKYLENPQRILSISDVEEQVVGDLNAVRHVLEFLDHWGLINYQVPSGSSDRIAWQHDPAKLVEIGEGELQAAPQGVPLLTGLYHFDTTHATHSSTTEVLGSGPTLANAVVSEVSTQGPAVEYHCNSCSADCSKRRYHCQKQADFDLCPDCFSGGKFGNDMSTTHFIRMDAIPETGGTDGGGWTDQETLLLLEALELYGDNWNDIAEHVATKSKDQCILHFIQIPIEDSFLEDMEIDSSRVAASTTCNMTLQVGKHSETSKTSMATPPVSEQTEDVGKEGKNSSSDGQQTQQEESISKAITAASTLVEGPSTNGLVAFADSANPVMVQVAFLAAMVGPRVAAAAAQSALMALSDEDPAASLAARNTTVLDIPIPERNVTKIPREGSEFGDKSSMANVEENNSAEIHSANQNNESGENLRTPSAENHLADFSEVKELPSVDKVRNAAATALGAAAVKAKLLADQEEREIQRLVAIVIENQLKKLELKLKHFGELEIMLKDECDQVERARQKQFSERARLVSSRFGSNARTQTQTTGLTSVNNKVTVPSSASTTSLQIPQPSGTAISMGLNRPAGFTYGPRGATPIPMSIPRPSGSGQNTIQQGPVAGSQANQRTPI